MLVRRKNQGELTITITRREYLNIVDAIYLAQMYMHQKGDFQYSDELGQLSDTMFIEYRSIFGGEK